MKKQLHHPPTLALTASAPPKVKAEIQEVLLHPDAQVFELPVNRPNIYLQVEKTNDKDAALMIKEKDLTADTLVKNIDEIMNDSDKRLQMGKNCQKMYL